MACALNLSRGRGRPILDVDQPPDVLHQARDDANNSSTVRFDGSLQVCHGESQGYGRG